LIRRLKHWALALGVTLLAACGDGGGNRNLAETANGSQNLTVLAEAVAAADLGGTLAGPGPFTLFAPTDAAFAALLMELGLTKAQLLADKPLLTKVLTYHVVAGEVKKADIALGKGVTTLEGGFFKIDTAAGDVVITDGRNRTSKITATDVQATNGVIHLVNKVLLPGDKTIVQTAQSIPDFSILVEAVVAADLAATLSQPGPFTVFAPTNAAFAALLTELGLTKEQLLADKPLLVKVLTYHVLRGAVLKADVPVGTAVTTLQGDSLTVDATLAITDQRARKAAITATDVLNSNGVIHVIDKVILPRP
jgi:uncharacterized surface protein with fasciclin (FAS1) repeats